IRMPEAIPAPRVECAVIAGLQYRLEHIIVLDDVPAPRSIADIDACAWYMVDGIVAHMDPRSQLDLHPRHLLLDRADVADEVIRHGTVGRKRLTFWSGVGVHFTRRHKLFIAVRR